MSTQNSSGMSWGTTFIIMILLLILWTLADFYVDYKKNNLSEQEKAAIALDQKSQAMIDAHQAKEFKSIGMLEFKDVKPEQIPDWMTYQALNNHFVKIGLCLAIISCFGFWYVNRKTDY